jgi:Phosphate transport regulator (distant homolog of PhoU)
MNFDKFLKFFVPKDDSFFPLFENDAQNLITACISLKKLLNAEDEEKRSKYIKKIKDIEHHGDEITQQIYDQLNRSFITPFDREDIHELATNIDDVVDSIKGVSRRINLYRPKEVSLIFGEIAEVLHQAGLEVEISVNGLSHPGSKKEIILEACRNLNKLEKKADDLYHSGIRALFEEEKDAIELIKKKDILETLEKCVNKAENISDTIKEILIKMA